MTTEPTPIVVLAAEVLAPQPREQAGYLAMQDPETARAMQLHSREVLKAKQQAGRDATRQRAAALLAQGEEAGKVANYRHLQGVSIEDIGTQMTRRMARLVMFGGPEFMPTSAKEATEMAKTWHSIAIAERRKNLGDDAGTLTDAEEAQKKLRSMEAELRKRRVALGEPDVEGPDDSEVADAELVDDDVDALEDDLT